MDTTETSTQADWRRYPYRLVPGDAQLDFPAAEGTHPDFESDTWYLAGFLTGTGSGRRFAFITIFNRNRPGGEVIADFHTFALFDLDAAATARSPTTTCHRRTWSPAPCPNSTSAEGYLDLRYESSAGTTTWTACRDGAGELVPYTYDFAAFGRDMREPQWNCGCTSRHAAARARRRVGLQRQDRRMSAGRHVLVLPDRHADGRNAALG